MFSLVIKVEGLNKMA